MIKHRAYLSFSALQGSCAENLFPESLYKFLVTFTYGLEGLNLECG